MFSIRYAAYIKRLINIPATITHLYSLTCSNHRTMARLKFTFKQVSR